MGVWQRAVRVVRVVKVIIVIVNIQCLRYLANSVELFKNLDLLGFFFTNQNQETAGCSIFKEADSLL
jgi:hypothetical protein